MNEKIATHPIDKMANWCIIANIFAFKCSNNSKTFHLQFPNIKSKSSLMKFKGRLTSNKSLKGLGKRPLNVLSCCLWVHVASTLPPLTFATACIDVMVMENFSKSKFEAPVNFCIDSKKIGCVSWHKSCCGCNFLSVNCGSHRF